MNWSDSEPEPLERGRYVGFRAAQPDRVRRIVLASADEDRDRVLRKGGRLLLSSLAKHEHRNAVEAYGHQNLGFAEKELRKFADKAGLTIASSETVTREKRPPHFEVISLIGVKP